jgi:hypothetical protein
VPVLVLGGYAMVAVLPVVVVAAGILCSADLRSRLPFRLGALGLGSAYALALTLWLTAAEPAKSLSDSLHPALAATLALLAGALFVGLFRTRSSRAS